MEPDEPRMGMFHNEFCNHAEDLNLHIDDICRHLLPDNVEGLCDAYFKSEANAMQYLCAVGIEREKVREYLDVAAKMFILCQTYSSVTLTEACQRVYETAVENGLTWYTVKALADLKGIVVVPKRRMESPKGEERTSARPAEPQPVVTPAPHAPERITRERDNVAAKVQRTAEAKIRSALLLRGGKNLCCNTLGEVGTSSKIRGDGTVFAYAEFMCPVCKKMLSSVSEVYRI